MSEQTNGTRTSEEQFPATWYEIELYRAKITPVVVKKVTKEFVTYYNDFWKKDHLTRRDKFFPTWAEAHTALVKHAEHRVMSAEAEWQRSKSALTTVKAMREPQ